MNAVPCNKCRQSKTPAEMGRNRAKANGLHHWCLACRREQNNARNRARDPAERSAHYRRRKYRLSPEMYDALRVVQAGKCAICKRRDAACVDHCHRTGVVRGLLCKDCNTMLRALDTWPHRDAAEAYLARTGVRVCA